MSDAAEIAAPELLQFAPADQIDLVCDAFEDAWIRDEAPQIEDYLNRCDASARELLIAELLLVDREFRIKQGEKASRQDYRQRFPDYSTIIDGLEFATIADRGGKRSRNSRVRPVAIPGSKLAHFELLKELGSGASGTVWKARDTRLRRIVAVKMPRQELLTDDERERFLREGQACAQLRHPNIVAVHEVGEDGGRVFIVAEFIEGLNLREWLNQHRPTPREAAELAAQLAEALHHAHEQGVIHRDLKPANVLMDCNDCPHITDFGLAKWTADSTAMTVEGNILGTPAYMSPEQARGDAFQVDRRADVYGLGALLYEFLTGQPPFTGEVAAIVHQVIHDEPRPPRKVAPAVPRDLETICLRAMEKQPSRRYPSAQEMAVDLRRFTRDEPILSRRTSRLEKMWRWLRRRPAIAALLVLALVVALSGMTIASLTEKNYKLQGYRRVRITTQPEGARVALVPIDERTGEPNPDPAGIVRPSGLTPLTTLAKPGQYFVEAVLPGDGDTPDFAEVYRTVVEAGGVSRAASSANREVRAEEGVYGLPAITISRTKDIVAEMVRAHIDEELRRKNPLLPRVLYVDAKETTAHQEQDTRFHAVRNGVVNDEGETCIPYQGALISAEAIDKRLPSAAEYDAVAECSKQHNLTLVDSKTPAVIEGLFGGVAEWTTTRYQFPGSGDADSMARLQKMVVLKAYGEIEASQDLVRSADGQLLAPRVAKSLQIGYRCVRSGRPRFVKP